MKTEPWLVTGNGTTALNERRKSEKRQADVRAELMALARPAWRTVNLRGTIKKMQVTLCPPMVPPEYRCTRPIGRMCKGNKIGAND
jgi:hypothetical protein